MSRSHDLAANMFFKRHGRPMPKNEVLEVVFEIIDHFNGLHWHDRDRYDERIKKLEQASKQP